MTLRNNLHFRGSGGCFLTQGYLISNLRLLKYFPGTLPYKENFNLKRLVRDFQRLTELRAFFHKASTDRLQSYQPNYPGNDRTDQTRNKIYFIWIEFIMISAMAGASCRRSCAGSRRRVSPDHRRQLVSDELEHLRPMTKATCKESIALAKISNMGQDPLDNTLGSWDIRRGFKV